MAYYHALKSNIANAIKTNGQGDITGDRLQKVLLDMVTALGVGYQFVGVVTSTDAPTPIGAEQIPRWWIAAGAGKYTHFGGLIITADIAVISWKPDNNGGKFEQSAVYSAPTLPVLELFDRTAWVGGFSEGVLEYIRTYKLADGAIFPIKISRSDDASDYFEGLAVYNEAANGISAVVNRYGGYALNVWITAQSTYSEPVYTIAGHVTDYNSFLTYVPIRYTGPAPTKIDIVGVGGSLCTRHKATEQEAQMLEQLELNIEGLPVEPVEDRYIYGDFTVEDGEIATAECVIFNLYPDNIMYYYYLSV